MEAERGGVRRKGGRLKQRQKGREGEGGEGERGKKKKRKTIKNGGRKRVKEEGR